MINCPKCGAGMYFDIKTQMLRCASCEAKMPVADYKKDINAEEHTYENMVYICKSCGARLMAPDEQATAFCPYCGNQSMIPSKLKIFETNKIIPFKRTREDIEKNYSAYISHKLFVPNEYKTPDGENSFRGIYIPHYNYKVNYSQGSFVTNAHRDYDEGNKHHHVTYANEVITDGGCSENIVRDASRAFDDNLSAAIAPYSHSEAVTFREAYLGDFYADIPSIESSVYTDEVVKEAVDELKEKIEKSCTQKDMEHDFEDDKLAARVRQSGVRADLYPVWFMTRRMKGGRVAYAVANGQTGKMAMDLPVDRLKFFLGVFAVTAALFALFSAVFGFISAGTLLGICCVVLSLSLAVLGCFAGVIHKRERGMISPYLNNEAESAVVSKAKKKLGKVFSTSTLLTVLIISIYLFSILKSTHILDRAPVIICFCALITGVAAFIFVLSLIGKDGSFGKLILNGIFSVLSVAACLILNAQKPIHDYYYVVAAVVTQVLTVINCLSVIGLFDRLCTHPVPDLFTREGAAQDD